MIPDFRLHEECMNLVLNVKRYDFTLRGKNLPLSAKDVDRAVLFQREFEACLREGSRVQMHHHLRGPVYVGEGSVLVWRIFKDIETTSVKFNTENVILSHHFEGDVRDYLDLRGMPEVMGEVIQFRLWYAIEDPPPPIHPWRFHCSEILEL